MKKLLIPFIASFGLSLGIATGVVMIRTPKPKPVAAAGTGGVKPDSGGVRTGAAKDSVTTPTSDSLGAVAQTSAAPTTGVTGPAAGANAATPGDAHAATQDQGRAASSQRSVAKDGAPTGTTQPPNMKLASSVSAPVKQVVPVVKPATDSLIGRRLAQVFGAMQPKDAARVLEQMDDNDVRAILGSLSSKKQAAILGSFPTQRAALILQATLRTASSGGTE